MMKRFTEKHRRRMMQVRITVAICLGILVATAALAQKSATNPQSPTPAPPSAKDVKLLDAIPNYAEILAHQWSAGVPQDVINAQRSVEHYGRLLEGGPQEAVTLQQCIALALQNNTGLKIQRLGPIAAGAQVRNAWGAFDPFVSADVTRDRTVTPASSLNAIFSPFTGQLQQHLNGNVSISKTLRSGGLLSLAWTNSKLVTNPSVANLLVPQYTTNLGLSLDQPLLRNFGWDYALLMVEVAQTTQQEAYYQYEAQIAALITQVEQAYWNLVLAIDNVQVQEQGVALAKEIQRQNEGKFKVGTLPQTAVLEAKSQVARREANLIQARNQRQIAEDNLRAILNYGKPGNTSLLVIKPEDKPTVVPYQIDLQRSLHAALEERPEILAARLDIEAKGLQRKVAENQLLPKLDFVGKIGVNGLAGSPYPIPTPAPTPGMASFRIEPNPPTLGGYGHALGLLPDGRFYNYSAGATIEIPLDNAQAKAAYAQANINMEQSRLSFQQLEENVTLEIKQAVSNLQSDLKSIDATRVARQLAEENLRNQKARYDVGLATTKDILDFQDQLTQARFAEVQALTTYNTDLAQMRKADGTLLAARNVMLERVSPEAAPWWAKF